MVVFTALTNASDAATKYIYISCKLRRFMAETKAAHDRIFEIVVDKDEVTWQSMVYQIFKDENMNPWDVEVSLIAERYGKILKKLKCIDFRVSGKVVLASVHLLKMKSQKLIGDDIREVDSVMSPEPAVSEEEFYEDLEYSEETPEEDVPALVPRTPQPRKRKVSIYDLMLALHKALEVRDRRVLRHMPSVKMDVPEKKIDMGRLIDAIHQRLKTHFETNQKVTFGQITKDLDQTRKIHSFLALLHLANADQRKIDLLQNEHFGEIEILEVDSQGVVSAENGDPRGLHGGLRATEKSESDAS